MGDDIQRYLAKIGSKGGRKSRRQLSPAEARRMVRVREARRAYRRYQAQCFWSFDPDYKITAEDIPWVADQLKKHGDRSAWETANKLCP